MMPAAGGEPDVVLLHGVGLAPCTFDPLLAMLPRSTAPLRRPYRPDRPAAPLPATIVDEAAELLAEIFDAGDPARSTVVVGVSGGATLALAMASVGHPRLLGVVAHEPLVGPAAPALHRAVSDAAHTLATGPGSAPVRATQFVRGLVGEFTWARLPEEAVAFPGAHADAVHAEVPRFVRFELPPGGFVTPVTVSTGERSHERRRHAAQVLEAAGAHSVVVPGAGHLAAWEQPATVVSLVTAEAERWRSAA